MATEQSEHLKKRFLAAFAKRGNVSLACRAAKVGRTTVYEWREQDPAFAAAWSEAELVATEVLEAEAWRRATQGVRSEKAVFWKGEEVGRHVEIEYSDTLLIFLLKARAPDKYRENSKVQLEQSGKLQIEVVYSDSEASSK